MNIHAAQCGNAACGKKQGIAGQERGDDQPRFAKDDDKENGINPAAVLCAEFGQMAVNMEDEIYRAMQDTAHKQGSEDGNKNKGSDNEPEAAFWGHGVAPVIKGC